MELPGREARKSNGLTVKGWEADELKELRRYCKGLVGAPLEAECWHLANERTREREIEADGKEVERLPTHERFNGDVRR